MREREDGVFRRRPGDAVRAVVGTVLVVALSYHSYHLTATERSIADFFHSLPGGARSLLRTVCEIVSIWAVGIVVTR